MNALRLAWTIAVGLIHVAVGLFLVGIVFRFRDAAGHDAIVRWWSARLVAICRVHVRVVPPSPDAQYGDIAADALRRDGRGAMLVLNHVSWLDIFIVHSLRATHFIAKAEIARWPVFGFLTARTGAVFIERGRRHAVREANHRVATMLGGRDLVGLFPEGTTSDGNRLLPFHGNLIQPAIDAQAMVVVAGVRYRDRHGASTPATLYTGDIDLWQSLRRIVRHGPVYAEFRIVDAIDTRGLTRHAVARQARAMIAEAFDFDDAAHEAREGLSTVIVVPDDLAIGHRFSQAGGTRDTAPGMSLDPRDELL